LAAVLRGRRASSTPLVKDQPEVGNGVAEQVEVGLKLVQTLRLKLLKQPLARRANRAASCSASVAGKRGLCPRHKPLPSIRSTPPPTAGSMSSWHQSQKPPLKRPFTAPSTDGLPPARRQRHPATYSSVASFGQDCCYDAI
jgi:hypothetical protein